jgi:hypothetical protein
MKKLFIVLIGLVVLITSCADKKTINGVTYRPYGLFNESTCKNDSIQYETSGWAVASGIVFFEVIVPPIYTFGFNLYEPVGLKKDYQKGKIKGVVN